MNLVCFTAFSVSVFSALIFVLFEMYGYYVHIYNEENGFISHSIKNFYVRFQVKQITEKLFELFMICALTIQCHIGSAQLTTSLGVIPI